MSFKTADMRKIEAPKQRFDLTSAFRIDLFTVNDAT